ncbi:MAG: SAM-dependent methyltransferase [bacterium]|nr:SAM-dependent methyltransferase [bacterium]
MEWNRGTLLQQSGSYWQTCALHSAVKLDIFTTIGENSLTAKELAEQTGLNLRGLTMLLNALTAMSLLIKKDDTYANTPESKTFLSKNSSEYIGFIMTHHHFLMESWQKLDQGIKTGAPVRTRPASGETREDEQKRESFLMGMFNMASGQAPEIVAQIDLSSKRRLLDLGGGPGTYAIRFCEENPDLTAAVFDLPTSRPFAEKTIKKFNLEDRVEFIPGNFLEDKIPGTYDAAWLSHILHGEDPEGCKQIIEKTVGALKPGGLIIIHEFILDNTMDGPLFPALFSLNMFLGGNGQSYSEEQLIGMLEEAGASGCKRLPFTGSTGSGLITGVKP